MNIAEPFATVESADSYFSARAYSSGWMALADDETKAQYLNLASVIIRIFSSFTSDDAEEPVSIDDPEVIAKYALLDGIAEKYQSPESSDPALEKRFSALENGMNEIKQLLQKTQQLPPQPAPQPVQYVPQYQPQPVPQFYTPSPVISTPAPIMPPIIQPSYGR